MNVIIFGAGNYGNKIVEWVQVHGDFTILAMADNRWDEIGGG